MSTETAPEPVEWRVEQVLSAKGSGMGWQVVSHEGYVNEVRAYCILREDADQIIRDHHAAHQASKGMALLAGEVADARQEAMQAKTAARIAVEALRDLLSHVGNPNPAYTDKRTYVLKGHGKAWEDSVNRALDALASLSRATEEK